MLTFRTCVTGLLWTSLWTLSGSASSQNTVADSDSPRQALLAARNGFGLETKGSPPFHLKAHFDAFDADGKPLGAGIVEEYSDGDGRYRTETSYEGATQTVWHTPSGSRLGDPLHESYFAKKVIAGFFQPLPPAAILEKQTFEEKLATIGQVPMRCIVSKPQPGTALPPKYGPLVPLQYNPTYCLSVEDRSLRLERGYPDAILVYNKLVKFGQRTIPYSVKLSQNNKVRADLEVDTLEAWTVDDAVLTPPPNAATSGSTNVIMSGSVVAGDAIEHDPPEYPVAAKLRNIQGTVIMSAVISRTGTVDDLEVISSPDQILSDAALNAVKRWKYKPYFLNGSPVPVDTTITVNFGPKKF